MNLDPILRRITRAWARTPGRIARRLVGAPITNDRGNTLDAHLKLIVALERRLGEDKSGSSPDHARSEMRRSIQMIEGPRQRVADVQDRRLPRGVRLRIYHPDATPLPPLLLYLHGGGWVAGDLCTHDVFCRRLCHEAGIAVASVDYRLAPEHPFPAGLDDALLAWNHIRDNATSLGVDPDRLAIGGDSAGGNLAAAACLLLRDAAEPLPRLQVLIYPATDMHCDAPSHLEFAEGFILTHADISWYRAHYAAPDWDDPRVSPLLASNHAGLPPAVVLTAGFDPLRDEGEAYVRRLRDANVPVEHINETSLVHGFLQLDGVVPAADRAISRLALTVRGQLA